MIKQFSFFKKDLQRFQPKGQSWTAKLCLRMLIEQRLYAIFIYRLGRCIYYEAKGGILLFPLRLIYILVNKFFVEMILGFYIPADCKIGSGLYINNFQGLVINPNVIIGDNCSIGHGVIIGSAGDGTSRAPVIAKNVYIGSQSIIIGPITIGDNVRIGANALVNRDVPSNVTIAGVPAKIVNYFEDN